MKMEEQVLADYLEGLLTETVAGAIPEAKSSTPSPAVESTAKTTFSLGLSSREDSASPREEEALFNSEPKSDKAEMSDSRPLQVSPALPEGCPDWIREEFSVQLFRLGNLRFAVPRQQLRDAIEWEGEIETQTEGPDWSMGRVSVGEREMWAVDPAEWILPGKSIGGPYGGLLFPSVGDMALVCRKVEALSVWLPAGVRWRADRNRRPWLLGMAVEAPCPLIDLTELVQDLQSGRGGGI